MESLPKENKEQKNERDNDSLLKEYLEMKKKYQF